MFCKFRQALLLTPGLLLEADNCFEQEKLIVTNEWMAIPAATSRPSLEPVKNLAVVIKDRQ